MLLGSASCEPGDTYPDGPVPSAPGSSGRIAFAGIPAGGGPAQIFTMNPDGSNRRQLTNGDSVSGQPAWSPDGSRIFFSSVFDSNSRILAVGAGGGGARPALLGIGADLPSVSTEGGIAFVRTDAGTDRQIWRTIDSGSGVEKLTSDGRNGDPAWSPDGRKIAFVSGRDGNFEIYVMKADGSAQTRLTDNELGTPDLQPAWSPDGTKIAFSSRRDALYGIFTMNADGSEQTRLSSSPTLQAAPTWSPDGARIAYTNSISGNLDIFVMDSNGDDSIDIASGLDTEFAPAWSPVPLE